MNRLIVVGVLACCVGMVARADVMTFMTGHDATAVAQGANSETLLSDGYLFEHSLDKYWSSYPGGPPTGRYQEYYWPTGLHSQAITAGPSLGAGANLFVKREDGQNFDITGFSIQLISSNAGAGGYMEIMPVLNGEDALNDPIQLFATGGSWAQFSYTTPQLVNYEAYKLHLWGDWGLKSMTVDGPPVPEPTGLAVVGLAAVVMGRRRR